MKTCINQGIVEDSVAKANAHHAMILKCSITKEPLLLLKPQSVDHFEPSKK
jgi:hypothetical protein